MVNDIEHLQPAFPRVLQLAANGIAGGTNILQPAFPRVLQPNLNTLGEFWESFNPRFRACCSLIAYSPDEQGESFNPRFRACCSPARQYMVADWIVLQPAFPRVLQPDGCRRHHIIGFPSTRVSARVAAIRSGGFVVCPECPSTRVSARVAAGESDKARAAKSNLQPAFPRVLQHNETHINNHLLCPSTRVSARVAASAARTQKSPGDTLQPAFPRVLQLQKRANSAAHARITMCILTFSSVLPALQSRV